MNKTERQEQDKNPELYTFLWETFKLSQGNPKLQVKIFQWVHKKNMLPQIPSKPSLEIYNNFGSPTAHTVSGQTQVVDWQEAKNIWQKNSHTHPTELNSLVNAFLDKKILTMNELI